MRVNSDREPTITIVTLKSGPGLNSAWLDGVEFSKFGCDVKLIDHDLMQKGECNINIISKNIDV
jgi:hypothetical protein